LSIFLVKHIMSLAGLIEHSKTDNKSDRLAVISSKNPTHVLIETVRNIKLFYEEFDIVIIDSDSDNIKIYELLPKDCTVDYCKNKNYELGAWNYAFTKYNNYKVYMFIQDTLTPNCRIPNFDKTIYKNGTIYTIDYYAKLRDGGYLTNLQQVYKNTVLHFISELDPNTKIRGAAHTSFILNKEDVYTILKLEHAYIEKGLVKSKIDSWLSERTCGIMADTLTRINITPYFTKINGNRV